MIQHIYPTLSALVLTAAAALAGPAHVVPRPDLPAVLDSSVPRHMAVLDDVLIYSASHPLTGRELWRWDGTGDATLVADVCPGRGASDPSSLTVFEGRLHFMAKADCMSGSPSLLATDGTPEGTVVVARGGGVLAATSNALFAADQGSYRSLGSLKVLRGSAWVELASPELLWTPTLTPLGDRLLFVARNDANGDELWVSDGTQAGTHLLRDVMPGTAPSARWADRSFLTDDGIAYLQLESNRGCGLWRSDGTAAGTRALVNAPAGIGCRSANDVVATGGIFFVSGAGGLWRTDGTQAGTFVLDTTIGLIDEMAAAGRHAFLVGGNSWPKDELWVSDGTVAGTVQIPGVREPGDLTPFNGEVYFRADLPFAPVATPPCSRYGCLWGSDGTADGTRLLNEVAPSSSTEYYGGRALFDGRLVFAGWREDTGSELWTTDGTVPGTRLAVNLVPPTESLDPWSIVDAGGRAVFTRRADLWTASPDGSEVVPRVGSGRVRGIAVAGEQVVYTSSDDFGLGDDVLVWDGSSNHLIENLRCEVKALTSYGGAAYFLTINRDGYQHNLYRTDGGPIELVAETPDLDRRIVSPSGDPIPLCVLWMQQTWWGDEMLFASDYLMVASDGTAEGTRTLLLDTCEDLSCELGNIASVGGALYVMVEKDDLLQLWRTVDGVGHDVVGTFPGIDDLTRWRALRRTVLVPWGDAVAFAAPTPGEGLELWTADAGGARLLADLRPGPEGSSPRDFLDHGGRLFFTADAPATFDGADSGRELWVADGDGVRQVRDIFPGPRSSLEGEIDDYYLPDPQTLLAPLGDAIFFGADDGVHGVELWASDGTAAGTHLLQDLVPGRLPSSPRFQTAVGETQLYWNAGSSAGGFELWTMAPSTVDALLAVELVDAPPQWTPPGASGTFTFVVRNHGPDDLAPPGSWASVEARVPLSAAGGALVELAATGAGNGCVLETSVDHLGAERRVSFLVSDLAAGASLTCVVAYRISPVFDFQASLVDGAFPLTWTASAHRTLDADPRVDAATLTIPLQVVRLAGGAIPTLDALGLGSMGVLLALAALVVIRRRLAVS